MADEAGDRDASRIADIVYRLPAHERAVLLMIARRMQSGLRRYGPLDPSDGRDWTAEAIEELVDAIAYLTVEMVRRG